METTALIEAGRELAGKLSEAVGQGAGWLWPILVRQQYVYAAQNFIGFSLVAALVWAIARATWNDNIRVKALDSHNRYGEFDPGGTAAWTCILTVVGTALLAYGTLTALGQFINPEFYALDYLLSQVGK